MPTITKGVSCTWDTVPHEDLLVTGDATYTCTCLRELAVITYKITNGVIDTTERYYDIQDGPTILGELPSFVPNEGYTCAWDQPITKDTPVTGNATYSITCKPVTGAGGGNGGGSGSTEIDPDVPLSP